MREWALTNAIALEAYPALPFWRRWWRNYRARRIIAGLREMDDRMLRDIGVDRADVEWALRLPLDTHAGLALEERANEAARARRSRDRLATRNGV